MIVVGCDKGLDNKFRHLHKIVVERFRKRKIKYFVTSTAGSICVSLQKESVKSYF